MRINNFLGMTGSVIAVGSYVEMALLISNFLCCIPNGAYAPNGIPNADGFVDYYE